MPPGFRFLATRSRVVLLVLIAIVHVAGGDHVSAQRAKSQAPPPPAVSGRPAAGKPPEVRYGTVGLPAPVLEMRDAILAAVRTGRIEELRAAIELNEIKPTFGDGPVADPIAFLKQASADGEGRDVLAALANLLDAGWIAVPLGRDLENNRIYVWPYFAETGVANLTPVQEVELYRLVPPAAVQAMRAKGRYDHWRVGIAADGTWHVFSR